MRPTPRFKWLLIFLLPLTFVWKFVAEPPTPPQTQERIVRFLAIYDFNVAEETPVLGVPILRATRGDCRMIVAEGSADGSTRGIVRQFTTTTDQQFVVFRGYSTQPTWLSVTQDRWTRYLRKLGISEPESPPIMVVASYSCGAEQLPWGELSAY